MSGIDGETVLMLHMDGPDASTNFVDDSPSANTLTATSGAEIDTAESKFGGASGLFSAAELSVDNSGHDVTDTFKLLDNFTIDFQFRVSNGSARNAFSQYVSSIHNLEILVATSALYFRWRGPGFPVFVLSKTGLSLSSTTWYHAEFSVISGVAYIRLDGVLQASGTITPIPDNLNVDMQIAGRPGGGVLGNIVGHLDEFRISRVGRNLLDFTPPSAAYSLDDSSLDFIHPVPANTKLTDVRAVWNDNLISALKNFEGSALPSNPVAGQWFVRAATGDAILDGVYMRDAKNEKWLRVFDSDSTDAATGNMPLAGGTMTANLLMGNNRIVNLEDPTNDNDLATLAYLGAAAGYEYGTYVGNGVDDRTISLSYIGITPSALIVLKADSIDTVPPVIRHESSVTARDFVGGTSSLTIKNLVQNGFVLGTLISVNENGGDYAYLAFA